MDTLIAILRLAGALASLVAGIMRILSAASEFHRHDDEEGR